jgi:hypothetical protein
MSLAPNKRSEVQTEKMTEMWEVAMESREVREMELGAEAGLADFFKNHAIPTLPAAHYTVRVPLYGI